MANRLQKQVAQLIYIPEIKGRAYQPAYCIVTQTQIRKRSSRPSSGGSFTPIGAGTRDIPPGSAPVYSSGPGGRQLVGFNTPGGSGGYSGTGQTPGYITRTLCRPEVPEIPHVPARFDTGYNTGWNAGARSVNPVPENGYFEGTLPDNIFGVVVGLSDGRDVHTYGHASHALVARPYGITPIEHGAEVGSPVPKGSRVRIARLADKVRMFVDGHLIHTSNSAPSGVVYADATLYALSDHVDDPIIGRYYELRGVATMTVVAEHAATSGGVAEMRVEALAYPALDGVIRISGVAAMRVQTVAHHSVEYPLGSAASTRLEADAPGYGLFFPGGGHGIGISYASGAMGMRGRAGQGSAAGARGAFSRPVLTARIGQAEAEPTQAIGLFSMPALSARILSGGTASAEGRMAMSGKASEGPFFGGKSPAATWYRLSAWESYLPPGQLDGGDLAFPIDQLRLDVAVLFMLSEGIEVADELDAYLVISMEALEAIGVDDEITFHTIVQMALQERMVITNRSGVARKEAIQYAVNAVTGALSRYEGFGFKQFATAGGQTYAIKDDGLYRLEGDSDNGDTLNAVIDFGATDFGTAQSKRLSSVYAGIATDGCVYLRVSGDGGEERIYRATAFGDEARALTAKGLSARHWRIRLELMDASYADVDNLELEIGVSQRRLRR